MAFAGAAAPRRRSASPPTRPARRSPARSTAPPSRPARRRRPTAAWAPAATRSRCARPTPKATWRARPLASRSGSWPAPRPRRRRRWSTSRASPAPRCADGAGALIDRLSWRRLKTLRGAGPLRLYCAERRPAHADAQERQEDARHAHAAGEPRRRRARAAARDEGRPPGRAQAGQAGARHAYDALHADRRQARAGHAEGDADALSRSPRYSPPLRRQNAPRQGTTAATSRLAETTGRWGI